MYWVKEDPLNGRPIRFPGADVDWQMYASVPEIEMVAAAVPS